MGVVFQKSALPMILHFARVTVAPLPHVISGSLGLSSEDGGRGEAWVGFSQLRSCKVWLDYVRLPNLT